MKIRVTTTFAGPDVLWKAYSIQEVEDRIARRMIEAGQAVEVTEESEDADLPVKPVERATDPKAETATRRSGRKKRK